MLNQKVLKCLLHYDPETGLFMRYTWQGAKPCGCKDSQGYIRLGVSNKVYYAHRLAWLYMTGNWPLKEIDHKNRIRSDNRWNNLQEASRLTNEHNKERPWAIPYISYQAKAWVVRIGRKKYVGRFVCLGEALRARARAIKELG